MNVRSWIVWLAAIGVLAFSRPEAAKAQDLGVFQWLLDPLCNVITLRATQSGNVFEVTGWDENCGEGRRAGVFGNAFFNPDGTIGLAFTTLYPNVDAFWFQQYAILDPGTLSGTWVDHTGDSGDLIFLGPAPSVAAERSATSGRPRRQGK